MKLENKYLKCFSQEKSAQLQEAGFVFLYEKAGVYYHQNNEDLVIKFSNTNINILDNTKFSSWIGL